MTENEAIAFCYKKAENIKMKAEPQTFIDIAKQLEELKQYRAIGTVEEFKALKEKSVAKKPIELDQWGEYWKCPTCGKYAVNDLGCKYKYCPNCGTEFDWESAEQMKAGGKNDIT